MNEYDYDPNFYEEILNYYEHSLGRLIFTNRITQRTEGENKSTIQNDTGLGHTWPPTKEDRRNILTQ